MTVPTPGPPRPGQVGPGRFGPRPGPPAGAPGPRPGHAQPGPRPGYGQSGQPYGQPGPYSGAAGPGQRSGREAGLRADADEWPKSDDADETDGDRSGHPAVDAVVAALANAAQLAPAEQVAEYEAAHRVLQETLAGIDRA